MNLHAPKTRRYVIAAAVSVLLVVVLVLFLGNDQPVAEIAVRPVKLLTVGSSAATPVVELAGEVRARVESRLGFRVSGKIISRRVEAGQHVRRGEELARIDPRDYLLAQNSAQANIATAQADLDIARSELERFVNLRQQGFVSIHELERKQMAASAAEATFAHAKNAAMLENNRLSDTILRADADGVITRIDADAGEVVTAGTPVIQLARDGAREIVVEFPEHRAALAAVAIASVSLWAAPDKTFPAKLRELAASADPVTRTFRARYSVTAPTHALTLGQSATLTLRIPAAAANSDGAIRLPTTALTEHQGATHVWVYDPTTATVNRATVAVIGLDGNEVLVSGLIDGKQVVIAGTHVLTDGQKVRPLIATPR